MNQILIPSDKSRGEIISILCGLEIGQKAYFNMFQEGGACIERMEEDVYLLYSIPLYGGEEDIKTMVDGALSWT